MPQGRGSSGVSMPGWHRGPLASPAARVPGLPGGAWDRPGVTLGRLGPARCSIGPVTARSVGALTPQEPHPRRRQGSGRIRWPWPPLLPVSAEALCAEFHKSSQGSLDVKRTPPVLIVSGQPLIAGVAVGSYLIELRAALGGPSEFELDDTTQVATTPGSISGAKAATTSGWCRRASTLVSAK